MEESSNALAPGHRSDRRASFRSHAAYLNISSDKISNIEVEAFGEVVAFHFSSIGAFLISKDIFVDISSELVHTALQALHDDKSITAVVFPEARGHLKENRWKMICIPGEENWRLPLARFSAPAADDKSRIKRLEYYGRRMQRDLPSSVITINRPALEENIRSIIRFNRDKIRKSGKNYGVDGPLEQAIVDTAKDDGFDVTIYDGSNFVGGAIIYTQGRSAYLQAVGYNEAYMKFSPAMIALKAAIDNLIARDFTELNLLWGDAWYKSWMGAERERLKTYIFYRNLCDPRNIPLYLSFARRRATAVARRMKRSVLERGKAWRRRHAKATPSASA